ncbi:MAG: non-canonical purine NTP pyrophosphatase, RdgB/HAM1 family [Planctomycetota bacterium]|nr:MAG: non-canonical purine NTP pyrophosphatase, RdgB/HAM1 family [Planctomycetota bacterium]
MNKVVIATSNKHKVKEINTFLSSHKMDSVGLNEFDPIEPPVEDAETFLGNAELKALYYSKKLEMTVMADDSGLCVNALKGAPGVRSSRFASENASDEENNNYLLEQLSDQKDRRAYFQCVIALCLPEAKRIIFFVGKCEGVILNELQGAKGFGYDPLFLPDGASKTFAEMTSQEKNKISHRGIALGGVEKFLTFQF